MSPATCELRSIDLYFGPAAPAAVAPCGVGSGVGGLGLAESEYVVAFCMQKSASAGL